MAVTALRNWRSDHESGTRLYFWCPGCSDLHGVEVGQPGGWSWNGDLVNPTVEPSVKVSGVQWDTTAVFFKPRHAVAPGQPICCHSYIRNGHWEFLEDCTHNLAGQTVPLPAIPTGLLDA